MMDNPRLFFVIDTFLPLVGGAEKQALQQARYLRARQFAVTIVTMRYQRDWPLKESLDDVPVLRVGGALLCWREHVPGVLRRFCYLLALVVLAWRLWRCRHDYDIAHVFQLTLFTLPALLVCRLARKRLVVSMRNDASSWQGNELTDKRQVQTRADMEALQHLGRPVVRWINRQLRLVGAHLVVLSSQMRGSLERCGLEGAGVLLIPNGVDTLCFQPWPEQRDESPLVVCVAKMRYQKGIDLLLRAWQQVVREMPRARLLLIGDGPLLGSLEDLAESMEIMSSVTFTGFCANVVPYLQRAHIAVLPSRWEGMSNALLEAMACGLACIATRVSGSTDLLQDETYGLLVEPEDVPGLASTLVRLLRQPDLVQRYSQLARQHVEEHYAFQRVMEQYLRLYNETPGKGESRELCVASAEYTMRQAEDQLNQS